MTNKSETSQLDRDACLSRHGLTVEEFQQTGLDWTLLNRIFECHQAMFSELNTTATYIAQRLQHVPAVHSLKVRIKDPEHLKALSQFIRDQAVKLQERDVQIAQQEDKLKKAVSQLQISSEEKRKLEKQIEELRKSSHSGGNLSIFSTGVSFTGSAPNLFTSTPNYLSPGYESLQERICSSCGAKYKDDPLTLSVAFDRCPACRRKLS